jgi:hypothetical protein
LQSNTSSGRNPLDQAGERQRRHRHAADPHALEEATVTRAIVAARQSDRRRISLHVLVPFLRALRLVS